LDNNDELMEEIEDRKKAINKLLNQKEQFDNMVSISENDKIIIE
jgi:hypothetical protein